MKIEKTKNTPEVIIENDTIQLNGESYPENSTVFYHPIIEWINKKMDKKENINMIFNLSYFNTNSLKVISDLFFILDKYELKNEKKVKIVWYHDEYDIDMKESVEIFFNDVNFNYEIRGKND